MFNRRGCPATGRMFHYFDKATHQCKCGRWERGFKPKTEPTKPRAECQICGCKQACDKDGTIGHHGYKRPGYGFIQGDCFGEGWAPYPKTDALEAYLVRVECHIELCRIARDNLPKVTSLNHTYSPYRSKERITVSVNVGDEQKPIPGPGQTEYLPWNGTVIPSFGELKRRETARLMSEIDNAMEDCKRIRTRIVQAHEDR